MMPERSSALPFTPPGIWPVQMLEDLPSASARELMERKAWYLDQMIRLLPVALMDPEVEEKRRLVQKALLNYW